MMDASPSPEDLEAYRYADLLRQPGNVARLLAYRGQREQRARDMYDPRRELWPGGPQIRRSDVDFYLGEALPTMAGAAMPALAPAKVGQAMGALGTLRRLYNARNEQVYGPQANYGYYGPGQRTFDAASMHGDSDMVGPVVRFMGYDVEPEVRHAPNLYDLLGVRP